MATAFKALQVGSEVPAVKARGLELPMVLLLSPRRQWLLVAQGGGGKWRCQRGWLPNNSNRMGQHREGRELFKRMKALIGRGVVF